MNVSSDNQVQDYGANKALVNKPLQWTDLALSEQVKGLRFFRDRDNNIVVFATMGFDPTQTGLNVLPISRIGISDPAALNTYARVYGNAAAGWLDSTLGLVVQATHMLDKIVAGVGTLEAQRTPTLFKHVTTAAAGNTAVWSPPGGKKFRLLGGVMTLTKEAACAGALAIYLNDGGGVTILEVEISAAALVAIGAVTVLPFTFPGNGYLSANAANALNVNLSGALTAGALHTNVWGNEE